MLSGIPMIDAYEAILESPVVEELEETSKQFNGSFDALKRWSGQAAELGFSRKWEYPFAIDRLDKLKLQTGSMLDAASGANFFPFYLRNRFPGLTYTGLDIDERACRSFNAVVKSKGFKNMEVGFGDLRRLNLLKSEIADVVLCISVIEHIPNPFLALHELHRVLKPGGTMIITFDIKMPVLTCAGMPLEPVLEFLYGIFYQDIPADVRGPNLESVSTEYILEKHPQLLPWDDLKNFQSLIFYCDAIQKATKEPGPKTI